VYSLVRPRGPGGYGAARAAATPKKTPPTTVRFDADNDRWIRERAASHPEGQSGVINDAVTEYRLKHEKHSDSLYNTITGANRNGQAQDS
jgi:hypothetical protein